ncbi:MAG: hypothetical protein ACRDWS_10620 [Acidimicrobiia bacterium]
MSDVVFVREPHPAVMLVDSLVDPMSLKWNQELVALDVEPTHVWGTANDADVAGFQETIQMLAA